MGLSISSVASPNTQFAQHVNGCLYLFKLALGIEVNFLRKVDIFHFIVQPTPNITQQHDGSVTVVLC